MCTLNAGVSSPNGCIGVIAPGTGLGESFLSWDGSHYVAHSSEGGHADFAPTDERQIRLLEYMLKRFDHVSFEYVCSGIGIPNIYEFLREAEHIPEKPEVAKAVGAAKDPSVVIIESAIEPHTPSKLCRTTIDMFVSILAGEAGNLALKVFATGGIYLAGGVPVHILGALQDVGFMESFNRKGRFIELMERIPIHVVTARAALVGAATFGRGRFKDGSS